MRKQHLANEEDLQGYFMKRISDYLRKKGREVIGWDELTNSSFLPEESIILGWQGMGTAALKAAEKGHRFIMTPARIMYLIRYQGPQWFEPVTYFGNNTLKDVFDYEPVQKDWKPEYESLLILFAFRKVYPLLWVIDTVLTTLSKVKFPITISVKMRRNLL